MEKWRSTNDIVYQSINIRTVYTTVVEEILGSGLNYDIDLNDQYEFEVGGDDVYYKGIYESYNKTKFSDILLKLKSKKNLYKIIYDEEINEHDRITFYVHDIDGSYIYVDIYVKFNDKRYCDGAIYLHIKHTEHLNQYS